MKCINEVLDDSTDLYLCTAFNRFIFNPKYEDYYGCTVECSKDCPCYSGYLIMENDV